MNKCKIFLGITILLMACEPAQTDSSTRSNSSGNLQSAYPTESAIPLDSANKMINSYLTSINASTDTTKIQSLIFDAEPLRYYLNDMASSGDITKVKLMFAHSLDYINSGNQGVNAGYQTGALTIIIAGYDEDGDYILYPGSTALNKATFCPPICPPGAAGSPTFPTN